MSKKRKKSLVGWTWGDLKPKDLLILDDVWIRIVNVSFQKQYLANQAYSKTTKIPMKKVLITLEEL